MNKQVWLCIFLFLSFQAVAQKPVYTNQQWFKVEDGLPQSFVSDLVQDDDGFLWISTMDGITRYDGRIFKPFRPAKGDSNNLSSRVVYYLAINPGNKIWMINQAAKPDLLDPRTGKIKHYSVNYYYTDDRKKVHQYESGTKYWTFFTDSGVAWVDPLTEKKFYATKANGLLQDDNILSSRQDDKGLLWLLSRNGVQVSNKERTRFEFKPFAHALPDAVTANLYYQMAMLNENVIVVPGMDALWFIQPPYGVIKKIPLQITSTNNPVSRVCYYDNQKKLYIHTEEKVYRVENDLTLTLIWQNNVMPGRRITSMLIDRSQVLWVGIDAAGLVRVNLRSMPMKAYSYENNFQTDALMEAGVSKKDIPQQWIKEEYAYDFRNAYGIDSALYLCDNRVLAPQPQLFAFKNGKLFPLPVPYMREVIYRGITTDKQGGLWTFDTRNIGIWHWRNIRDRPQFIKIPFTADIAATIEDLLKVDDYFFISTSGNGLLKVKDSASIEQFNKKSGRNAVPYDLTRLCKDPVNPLVLWIGTRGEGLIQWHLQNGLQRIFTEKDGLPNNTVYSIVADRFNKLWLTTNKGMCRFDPQSFETHNFEKSDGLPGNEFNRFHDLKLPDGRIVFGGVDGYVAFDPADFTVSNDSIANLIQFTEILINNHSLVPGAADGLLPTSLSELKELVLPYDKNYITASFAALQFNDPQKIKYRYRLKGLSNEWIETGFTNTAYYTELRPGTYVLEIMATNAAGKWGNYLKQLTIKILPPLWARWWAYIIYGLLATGMVILYLRYRDKRLKEKQELIFKQRETEQLRELDEVKTRFFSNITHELRTPLTLISTPLEKLQRDENLSSPVKATIRLARQNAMRLMRLINQLLDLSKLDAGQMKVDLSAGELPLFVEDVVNSFTQLAVEKNIGLNFNSNNVEGLFLFDREKWDSILVNFLGNAVKFTPGGGKIEVSLKEISGLQNIRLQVKDNGHGMTDEMQKKIFERFYQADSSVTRQHEGTGIGLSLVQELVRLMNGTVTVESETGKGTLFTVLLPVEKIGSEPAHRQKTEPGAAIPSEENNSTAKNKPVVLVAEDNEELRRFIVSCLDQKFTVLEATDGISAREKIIAEMPDMVISDVMMPGMDGIELCRLCKNDMRTAHIGFIMLTARSTHSGKMEGLESGADHYITKPFHLDELETCVRNQLQLQENLRIHLKAQLLPGQPDEKPAPLQNPFLIELYAVLEKRLDDSQLNVETLASALNMSRSSLNRKLKTMLDTSASDLIKKYRLQQAASMLKQGIDITNVAYQSGFSSPSYFAQCFKEEYQITPSAFAEQHK